MKLQRWFFRLMGDRERIRMRYSAEQECWLITCNNQTIEASKSKNIEDAERCFKLAVDECVAMFDLEVKQISGTLTDKTAVLW